MSSLFLLIPLSVLLVTLACLAFGWAARSGQFDDLERGAAQVMFDDEHD